MLTAGVSRPVGLALTFGKVHQATTDARKYADYVVTDTPAPAAPPVPGKA
ncbi:hypothetical protein [Hymenobacter glaciei]